MNTNECKNERERYKTLKLFHDMCGGELSILPGTDIAISNRNHLKLCMRCKKCRQIPTVVVSINDFMRIHFEKMRVEETPVAAPAPEDNRFLRSVGIAPS